MFGKKKDKDRFGMPVAPTVQNVVLHVPDMHCNACVSRIDVALKVLNLTYAVSLGDKTVTINGDRKQVEAAKKALDDMGFLVSDD